MSRRSSNTQSIQVKDICILLVNDDYICQGIVVDMLDHCRYEAFSCEKEMDALDMIWEKKDVTELILTNVHRTYAKKHGIIEHIEKKIKLQIILMSAPGVDDMNVSTVGGDNGVTIYYMKCMSVNEMNNLWATALAREKNKKELSSSSSGNKENAGGSKRSMSDDGEQNGNAEKKPRMVWTKDIHQKFLVAYTQLGEDKAFPKKIVELMNVEGLTRANVASHLQKHRMSMKRAKEGFTGSSYDNFGFDMLQKTFQQSHWSPFQMGSRNTPTTHFNYNYYKSRSRIMPQSLSLLNTIRWKPDFHNFSVYGDEAKNILVTSLEDSKVHPNPNTSFAGFRFARDGKSVVFGQNSHLPSSFQQQFSFPEIRNDNSTHCQPSFTPQESSSVSLSSELSSLAADEPSPAAMTQLQPAAERLGFDWAPSSVAAPYSVWDGPLKFSCKPEPQKQLELGVSTPPQAAGLQWSGWADEQPPSGNTANATSDIFGDFTSTLEFCELGTIGDHDIGVDATAIPDFDDLLDLWKSRVR